MYFYQTITILGRTISIQISNQNVWLFKILAVPKPDKQTYGLSSRCNFEKRRTNINYKRKENS